MGRDTRNLVYFRRCLNANTGIPENVVTGNLRYQQRKEKGADFQLKRRICIVPKQHELQ